MEHIRNIAIAFCAAAIFTGAVGLLSGRTLEKSIRYITALILLCTVLTSIVGADWNLEVNSPDTKVPKTETLEALSIYEAEYLITELLRQHTVNFEKITVTSTKTEDDCIIINEIAIKGADDRKKTESALKSAGIDCRVVFK